MIKRWGGFLIESNNTKHYVCSDIFRLGDLLKNEYYPDQDIISWMNEYKIDELAHCIFISKDRPKFKLTIREDLGKKLIKKFNDYYFYTDSKINDGFIIPEANIDFDGILYSLYIFTKNSNENNRARQIHGFKYEGEIRRLNGLANLEQQTHKWDAKGDLDKHFIDERKAENKTISYYDGSGYVDLIWEKLPSDIKGDYYWNIKSSSYKTEVCMADFLRISGYEKIGGKLKLSETPVDKFIYCVGFTTESGIKEEYVVLIDAKKWKNYIPNINKNLSEFENMYKELELHRLKGERTTDSELNWLNYRSKYSKLTDDTIVKLRFKRDTKGQIRIQSAISYKDFINVILKENKHIKII